MLFSMAPLQLHSLFQQLFLWRFWRDHEGFAHKQRSCDELLLRDLLVLHLLLGLDGGMVVGASGGYRGTLCFRVGPWQPAIINKIFLCVYSNCLCV